MDKKYNEHYFEIEQVCNCNCERSQELEFSFV